MEARSRGRELIHPLLVPFTRQGIGPAPDTVNRRHILREKQAETLRKGPVSESCGLKPPSALSRSFPANSDTGKKMKMPFGGKFMPVAHARDGFPTHPQA